MKIKTRKSAAKRVIIKKGFLARKKAGHAHFLRRKSSKRLRHLFQSAKVQKSDLGHMQLMLPYN